MAILSVQQGTQAAGLTPSLVAADATLTDGFANDGQTILVLENSNAATRTVTITPPSGTTTKDGFGTVTAPTITTTLAATTGRAILGPFPTAAYNDGNGRVNAVYSANAGVTVAAVRVPRAL